MSSKSAFVGGFVGSALGSLAVNAPRGTFGKIWNVLCLIFLPLWVAFFGYAATLPMQAGVAPIGMILISAGPLVIFIRIAAIRATSPMGVVQAYGTWWNSLSSTSIQGKLMLSSPAILLLVAGIGAALGSAAVGVLGTSASAIAAIVAGVYIGKERKAYVAFAESVITRITGVVGSDLVDGSVNWTSNFETISVTPFPVEAMINLNALSDLHHRCSQFAPEYELENLTANGVTFVPVTSATLAFRSNLVQ